ncbi:MAG TPA: ABC transporter ATP-binding protein [Actinomycetes bacterium]|nr:ABC transporter ATP-binding protein [Actinomycetes bacterium]
MTGAALELAGVTKSFGGNLVLDDVTLTIAPGQVHAVIGPNGAGKSTLFGVIAGEHVPERGRVALDGRDITRVPAHRRVGLGVARAFQVAHVFPELTVRENVTSAVIAASGASGTFWRRRPLRVAQPIVDAALDQMRLQDLSERLARELSQGDRKRLEIAMALELRPGLLMLDEPTAGMSPEETAATVALVRELWERTGLTVLLTEHDMQVVFDLAQQLTVLNLGAVLATGEPSEVRAREDVMDVYLGRSHGAT